MKKGVCVCGGGETEEGKREYVGWGGGGGRQGGWGGDG